MGGARFVRANGLRFAYLQQGPPDGPLALCLHGFPDQASTWRHLLPVLAEAGYRAVAPWLRGYAPTAIPDDGRYDVDTLTADVNALHRALRGDRRSLLVGHDWGAVLAYRAAYAAPERWRRVVTMAVPPESVLSTAVGDAAQIQRSRYMLGFVLPGAARRLARREFAGLERLWRAWSPGYEMALEDRTGLAATFASPGSLHAALGYYRAQAPLVLRGRMLHGHGPLPPQPTLYLHGADDGCIGAEYAEPARPLLRTPGSGVVVMPGVGHFAHLEAPDAVAAQVSAFLPPAQDRQP